MPFQALRVTPGINTEATDLLNESGWSSSQLVRFFQGFLQKYGGWMRLISTAIFGTARAMLSWEDAASNTYIAVGSEQALEVYFAGVLYNITPVLTTNTITPSFTTTLNNATVKVTDSSTNPAATGDLIIIENPIAVGGLVLQGTYTIGTVIDAHNYNITAASLATAGASNTGSAVLFTTTSTSTTVRVTLNNHGFSTGQTYTAFISTTVGGTTINGPYIVGTVIDANNFNITVASPASGSTTGSENGGNVTIQYLLPVGNASNSNQGGLYGQGAYGAGTYGIGSSATFVPARLWSFGYWGTDIVASYTNGPLYTWISENGLTGNPATTIATAPLNINAGVFTAMPQQQVVACGASDGGGSTTDQMLVRWSDIADNTDWTATATNQAGSFRIPRGAHIAGGLQGPQTTMIWTDVGLWLMAYIGFPLVYGFTEIGQGCGLIWQNAKAVLAGKVYWMSFNGFFVYDGNSVQAVPCPVWDQVFQNLNTLQTSKIIACPNSYFNEISFCYPSANSNENDSRVTLNINDGTWTFDPPGAIVRTAWLDQSSLIAPLGVDGAGLIQVHETGNDADGFAMVSFAQTGFFKIAEGLEYTFLERLIPDFLLSNSGSNTSTMQITLYFQDYPSQAPIFTVGPLSYTAALNYLIVRGRGRLVSIKISSSDVGSFWRLGEMLYFGAPDGRR